MSITMASVDLQESANFIRFSKLLVDKGTEALRNTFDTIHPPVSQPGVLAANKTSLQKLKPRVINNSQWDLLFPPSGNPQDSKTFDITLLTVLLRNICGFPSTGWSVMPPDADRSMQANITRIKCYRNEVYAHVTSTRVHNSTFESLWKKISQILVDLGISQSEVDDLEKCPLGPEEEVYVQKLKDWKLHEDECIKMLATVTQIVEETRDRVNLLCQSLLKKSDNEIPQTSLKRTLSIPEDTNPEKKSRSESDQDLLQKLAKHNFRGKIKRTVNFFVPRTREWLLEEINEWFQKCDSDSRVKLITAGPGFVIQT
ncbi:E3 ubiquitin-protein ligase DZIP3-like [Dendronephthya gigantea]|uniref:E3 ubiquitin-protein ligase DZIP3-like n=1 Tax=Dendronephthya gigantea TaxID=151771 RepID=UPI00106924B5|nr:E3 ubiquitin-protein ligase DZIP3-like [Dendronephthya gigantea]